MILYNQGGEQEVGVEKTISKMKRQPNGIKYNEVSKILNEYGYELVRSKGSHRHFRNKQGDVNIKNKTPTFSEWIKKTLNIT